MIKHLSIGKRVALSNVLYGLPVIVMTALMYQAKTKEIDFSRWEIYGNIYQKPLMGLLENVSEHRLLSQRALHGDSPSRSALGDVQARIAKGFEELDKAQAQHGADLQFTEEGLGKRGRAALRPDKVRGRWNELKDGALAMGVDKSGEAHAKLIADLRGMITHSGDTSNLILDPDLDSYYMMDVTLLALPQLEDRLQDVVFTVESILRRRRATTEERIQLSVFAAMLQSDLERTVASTETAITEDPNFYGTQETLKKSMEAEIKALKASLGSVIAQLRAASGMRDGDNRADSFLSAARTASKALYSYSGTGDRELTAIIQTRVDANIAGRTRALIWGLLALLVAATLSTLLTLSVKGSLTEGLGRAIGKLRGSVNSARVSGTSLVDTSQRLSSASTEQAAAIQESVATLNEISAMVNKSRDNSVRSSEVAQKSHQTALNGKASVDEMGRAIVEISRSNDEIMKEIEESNRQIEAIITVIGEIGNKTKIINDIVFQTKLLSFNASVEAARAGEHGKGFAVVAEEVGNLARMSGTAAKEIGDMLASGIQKVNKIVEDTRSRVQRLIGEGRSKVDAGTQVMQRCGQALGEIVETVGEMNIMVSEISRAAEEQAKGVGEITKAMNQLDQTIHQNSQMAEQTAHYSENLSAQAETLDEVVKGIEDEFFGGASAKARGKPAGAAKKSGPAVKTQAKAEDPVEGLAKVIPLVKQASAPKAVGGLKSVPAADDSRFKEA